MGCLIRFTTTVTLIAGTQLTLVEMAQARFEPEGKTDGTICQVTSGYIQEAICPLSNSEEPPSAVPHTTGSGGGR